MYWAIEEHHPDQVIHLGDIQEDAEEVASVYPRLPFCMVPGNCDGYVPGPLHRQIRLFGREVLLSHGHIWGVKHGYEMAISEARKTSADILLFGHTHVPYCTRLEDGLWVMNPGACISSYGIISIEDGMIDCSLHKIP